VEPAVGNESPARKRNCKMRLRDLHEQRARVATSLRALIDKPEGEGGDLSEAQETRFGELKVELAGVEKKIERQTLVDEAERRATGTPLTGTGDANLDDALDSYSLRNAIAEQIPDFAAHIDTARERELSVELSRRAGRAPQGIMVPMQVFRRKLETRVMTTAAPAGGPGGNLIAVDHLGGQYIDILRRKLVMQRLGARVLSDLRGDVEIPKLSLSAAGHWVAENAAIAASDPEVDPVTLSPKHVGAITEYSRNMLLQSSPDIEELLRNDFAGVLANAVDAAAISGGGANEPVGILKTAGIGVVDMSAGPTWATVLELIADLEIANAEGAAFLTNPKVVKLLRSTRKVAATDSAMIQDGPNALAGYPLASTNNVSSTLTDGGGVPVFNRSALIFGDFSQVLIGYWSVFDILVNPYESTAYSKGNVQIRGMVTCDVALRHPEAFAAAVNVNAA